MSKMSSTSRRAGMTYRILHRIEDEHETDPAVVRQTARDLLVELNSRAIPLTILPGNEAFICPDPPDGEKTGDVLTLADRGTQLLLELPYEDLPTYVEDVIFRLQLQGITPVLAHVERYVYIRSDWHILNCCIQRGCLAQVNTSSLGRTTGDDLVQDLVGRGLVACTATDAHAATVHTPRSIWNEWGESLLLRERQLLANNSRAVEDAYTAAGRHPFWHRGSPS